jgi:hypothetical protein
MARGLQRDAISSPLARAGGLHSFCKTESIRGIVDTANDPHEISLDENVTRENMHPADQFEAFEKPADERGFGAEKSRPASG